MADTTARFKGLCALSNTFNTVHYNFWAVLQRTALSIAQRLLALLNCMPKHFICRSLSSADISVNARSGVMREHRKADCGCWVFTPSRESWRLETCFYPGKQSSVHQKTITPFFSSSNLLSQNKFNQAICWRTVTKDNCNSRSFLD